MEVKKPLDKQLVNTLLARWCPIFFLHHEERYSPCSFPWFLERAWLVKGSSPNAPPILGVGSVTPVALVDEQAKVGLGADGTADLSLWISPKHWAGQDAAEELDDVPVYAHLKVVHDDDGSHEALEITYITLYAYNGAYPLFGCPCFPAGGHVGDIEHITVRLCSETLRLQGVWYNSHRNLEGEWAPPEKVPRDPASGRIIAYVALNGHGVYPQPGIVHRLFCVANDFTSGEGQVWRPRQVRRLCGTHHGVTCPLTLTRGCSLPKVVATPGVVLPSSIKYSAIKEAQGKGCSSVTEEELQQPGTVAGNEQEQQQQEQQQQEQQSQRNLEQEQWQEQGHSLCVPHRDCSAHHSVTQVPEVVEDTSAWQQFRGRFGTADAPVLQCWFSRPEPPVSRTYWQRLLFPLAAGVERLHSKLT